MQIICFSARNLGMIQAGSALVFSRSLLTSISPFERVHYGKVVPYGKAVAYGIARRYLMACYIQITANVA